ncbi:MAG: ABC transporter ATP-binding protein [Spirochaetales bacterium]|nr:MAG: ABC transporter ATP-binding protein [Spirochaetales bacterium]
MGIVSRYSKRMAPGFLAALAFLALESICDLAQPALLARVLDEGVATGNAQIALRLGGMMLAVAAIGAIGASGRNIIASLVSFGFGADLRTELFSSVLRMPASRADGINPGSIVTRQTNDVDQIQQFANGMMRVFAKAPIICIGSLIMAVRVEPALAWIPALVVGLVTILVLANLRLGVPRYAAVQVGVDRVNSSIRGFLGGLRVVKAFGRFVDETIRFEVSNGALTGASIRAARTTAVFGPATALCANLGIVAVLWFGGYHVTAGRVPIGRVVAFISYMTQILFALTILSNVFSWFTRAKASYARITETLEPGKRSVPLDSTAIAWTRDDVSEAASSQALLSVAGAPRLELRGVHFSYPMAGAPALEDISFRCEPGSITAVIGSTGAGKSTLVRLLLGFYDTYGGSILLDNEDAHTLGTRRLRARVAVAPQSPSLFSGTIAQNIRWGLDTAGDDLVREAARIAKVEDFIDSLPNGIGTVLGRGGVNLSGGQRQRVSIARAVARILSGDGGLLILDDCTSAVDVLTEAAIREEIKGLGGRATVFWITQRVAITARSDATLVLENGRVAGFGPHDTLTRTCGVYRDILDSQFGDGGEREHRQ